MEQNNEKCKTELCSIEIDSNQKVDLDMTDKSGKE